MKELEDLEQENLEEELVNIGPLPSVPSTRPEAPAKGKICFNLLLFSLSVISMGKYLLQQMKINFNN